MDPIHRGPDASGHDPAAEDARPATAPALPERTAASPARARVTRIVSGGLLLTVNPVDGSEIEPCPPGQEHREPRRRTPEERAEAARAAAPPVPPGPAAPPLPLLERQETRERLAEILGRGRSARLTGPAGSGRTTLLDAVAADCADLAPDGVVRLSGHHRTATELLHDLFAAVRYAPGERPDRTTLPARLRDIGAVVVVDDLEFGGAALDELLAAAPECAFLLAAAPDVPAPSAESHVEEVALTGLGRAASLKLLESAVGRTLTDDEANWAGDLWFESEGLPLRFVQAGALLRQRDRLRVTPAEFDAFGALEEAFGPQHGAPSAPAGDASPAGPEDADVELREIPLPSLGEGAAPAALLASRLSRSAQATLRFAVALGGELPHQAHLPALVGDTHADAALGELRSCGLLTPVGPRHRLATGVLTQLLAHGYGTGAADRVHTAAQHYAWWAGHPSVTPERAAAEADALLAALTALLPGTDAEHRATAVLLARAAAPAFAASLHWGAWERALRAGQEAARLTGDVAEEAYFHHELGVLALCAGNLERARAELEASIALRGALADKRGTVAGRRALALVDDLARRAAAPAPAPEAVSPPRGTPALRGPAPAPVPPAASGPSDATPPQGKAALPAFADFPDLAGRPGLDAAPGAAKAAGTAGRPGPRDERPTPAGGTPAVAGRSGLRSGILDGARRNLVAVGAGALLVAVLGTVVTLGATSGDGETPATDRVTSDSSTTPGTTDDGLDPEEPPAGSGTGEETGVPGETAAPTGSGSPSPTGPGSGSPSSSSSSSSSTPGTSDSPSFPSETATTAPTTTTDGPTSDTPTPSTTAPTVTGGPAPTTTTPPVTPPTSSSPSVPTTPPSTTAPPTTTAPDPSGSASSSLAVPSPSHGSGAPETGTTI
ncbi:ATP-binding protein [Streptomyces gulbargensis]|uniref:ATP-binding protein n=1 Tax=Streptomyces gulbargensis TaxID=364901 RepID=A0ABP7MWN9_9ACTN